DSFQRIQSHLSALGLVLNTTKTKIMWFGRSGASQTGTIVTADGRDLEIMTVLPLFHYGDTIYRSACKGALDHLDVLYHSAIRFATNRTHHCDLYSLANWPSLETRRNIHWL
ncbi:hypothetical protein JOQ06_021395, partial [Pogonophryne albipinna]